MAGKTHQCNCLFCRTVLLGQKGAVENDNKLLRQYFPKGTDFREVDKADLDMIQAKINQRPREKLNIYSPLQQFFKHFRYFCTCLLTLLVQNDLLVIWKIICNFTPKLAIFDIKLEKWRSNRLETVLICYGKS